MICNVLRKLFPLILVALTSLACVGLVPGGGKSPPSAAWLNRTPAPNPTVPAQMNPLPPVQLGEPGGASPIPPGAAPTEQVVPGGMLPNLQDAQALRLWMLFSHTRWQSAWADIQVDDYAGGAVQSRHVQFWVQPPGKFRSLLGAAGGAPDDMYIGDGAQVRQRGQPPAPLPVVDGYNPPSILSYTVYPHPLEGMLGSPSGALLFPQGLAQRPGTYQVLGRETHLGRPVIVLDWSYQPGAVVDRFWVDTATGIVLRWQNYGKGGQQGLNMEMKINALQLDAPLPGQAFAVDGLMPGAFATGYADVR
jgi:hypothetical protein